MITSRYCNLAICHHTQLTHTNGYCNLAQPGLPQALALLVTNGSWGLAGESPEFLYRPVPNPRPSACKQVLQSNLAWPAHSLSSCWQVLQPSLTRCSPHPVLALVLASGYCILAQHNLSSDLALTNVSWPGVPSLPHITKKDKNRIGNSSGTLITQIWH